MESTCNDKPKLFAEARRKEIAELIQSKGSVSVDELSELFCLSAATIRSDLRILDSQGTLVRTHGGAITNCKSVYELNTAEKVDHFMKEKAAIADIVITYVNNGDTIGIDTGTTTFEIAKRLASRKNLTVVTTDISIASWLDAHTDFEIIIAGGVLRKSFYSTSGSFTLDVLNTLNLDLAIMATNGISLERGLSTPSSQLAIAKTAMIRAGEKVILACDHSKIDHNAFVSFASTDDIDVFVTDANTKPDFLQALALRGIEVRC